MMNGDDKLLLFALQVGNSIDARFAEGHGGGSQRLFGSGYRCPEHRQAQGRTLQSKFVPQPSKSNDTRVGKNPCQTILGSS